MDNTIFMIWVTVAFLLCGLILFALFTICFLIGYKTEDRRRGKTNNKIANDNSDEENKFKKEWKNFLEYDGSAPNNYE